MLFSLVLLLTSPAGDVDALIVDHAMTMEDCAPLARHDVRSIRIDGAVLVFSPYTARLVCEGEK